MFLLFAFAGTQIAVLSGDTTPAPPVNTSNLRFISLAFGFSLMINVWIFFRISREIIGPLWAGLLVVAQILARMTAAGLVDALLAGPLDLGTLLGGGINTE